MNKCYSIPKMEFTYGRLREIYRYNRGQLIKYSVGDVYESIPHFIWPKGLSPYTCPSLEPVGISEWTTTYITQKDVDTWQSRKDRALELMNNPNHKRFHKYKEFKELQRGEQDDWVRELISNIAKQHKFKLDNNK